MSTGYIGADLRRRVVLRAERLCEYCLIHEDDTFYGCEVDHISPLTSIGEATARLLGVNDEARLVERRVLRRLGRYPTAAALRRDLLFIEATFAAEEAGWN